MSLTPTFTPAAKDASNILPADWQDTVNNAMALDPAASRLAAGAAPISFVSVADYGATGDGTTDDTAAIQAALNALESSTTINKLYLPKGRYRLNTHVANSQTSTSSRVILTMGTTSGLDGRDIEIIGEPGAVLYSTTSPTRANVLLVNARMRSLKFKGLRWEKDAVVLAATSAEPNGCEAVSLVCYDTREIELFEFDNCTFYNMHGAFRAHQVTGNLVTGKLKMWRMVNCEVLNPYGSNTSDSVVSYGGGQQVNLGQWIQTAVYYGNFFSGGASTLDLSKAPGGILKDGCHFGGPVNLVFDGNTVENFGVEAVFQISNESLIGYQSAFTVPSVGSNVTTTVNATSASNFVAGDQLVAYAGTSARMKCEVVSWNSGTRALTLKNLGSSYNTAPGGAIAAGAIYANKRNSGTAIITNNILRHDYVVNGSIYSDGAGIVTYTRSVISNNAIDAYGVGIVVYGDFQTPDILQASGTLISNNSITLPDRGRVASTTYSKKGIHVQQDRVTVSDNQIFALTPIQQNGIGIQAGNCTIRSNHLRTLTPAANGYGSANRAVGIGEYSGYAGSVYADNETSGWDVGIGPITASASLSSAVMSHKTSGDVLGIDPLMGSVPTSSSIPFFGPDGTLGTLSSGSTGTDDDVVKAMMYSTKPTFASYGSTVSATATLSQGDATLTIATSAVVNAMGGRSISFSDAGGSVLYPRDFIMVMTLRGNLTATGDWIYVGHFVQPDTSYYSATSPHYIVQSSEGRWMVQIRKKATAFLEARIVSMTTAGVYAESAWVEIGASNYHETPKYLIIKLSGGVTRTVTAWCHHGVAGGGGTPSATDLASATLIGTAGTFTGSYAGTPNQISAGLVSPAGVVQTVAFANIQATHR